MPNDREPTIFTDRSAAGRLLAERLLAEELLDPDGSETVVLGLTRGGVPVAFEVATALAAPLDMVVVGRLGIPWQPETAMGALAEGGTRVVDQRTLEAAMVSPHDLDAVERHERTRLAERVARLRGDRPPPMLDHRTTVIVDDGIATGASARAACQAARERGSGRIIVATPIASASGRRSLEPLADQVLALHTPLDFLGVGQGYVDFAQIDDSDVAALLLAAPDLEGHEQLGERPVSQARNPVRITEMVFQIGGVGVVGRQAVPVGARELVIVAHDSSRERHSARSRYLSRRFTDSGLATLLVDLLTRDEERQGDRYLDIPMLADRLITVTRAARSAFARVDYLAESVAAAVALEAAADPELDLHAVACLSGRPDLVARLGAVRAPTLLVVGAEDPAVLRLNAQATERMTSVHRMVTIPGAGHRFREPEALQKAAAELIAWFLTPGAAGSRPPPIGACAPAS